MAQTKEILTLAVEIADQMLRNGAEIYRVVDTVIMILQSHEIDDFDVYVLSNGIFASANENKEDACSMIRHVPLGSVNLEKIAALNQLARDLCSGKCTLTEAWDRLEHCKKLPSFPPMLQIFCCGIVCACFSYLLGGKIMDAFAAFGIGILEKIFTLFCEKRKLSKIMQNIFTSMLITICCILLYFTRLPLMPDKIIIGSLMPLVPGIAFTTAIRDLYNSDYLSGSIHLIDAILTALCIAAGACLPLLAYQYLSGGILFWK